MEKQNLPETLRISKESRVPEWVQNAADCAGCFASLMLYALVTLKTIQMHQVYTEFSTRESLPQVVVTPSNTEASNLH